MKHTLRPTGHRFRLALTLPLLLCLACHDSRRKRDAGFLATEARLDTSVPGSSVSNNPQLCASGSTVYAIFEDERFGDDLVFFNRSTNGGKTWLAADILVPSSGLGLGDLDLRPGGFTCDGDNLYVVYEEDGAGGPEDVYFTRSTDGGLTWLPAAIKLDPGASGAADSGEQKIALEGSNLYVTFYEEVGGVHDVYFTRSTDAGATWSAPVQLDTDGPGNAHSTDIDLAVAGSNVYVVWSDGRNGNDDIYLNRSMDGGATWLPSDVRVNANAAGASVSTDAAIGCFGMELYVAYRDDRNGEDDVFFNYSTNGGSTWAAMDAWLSQSADTDDTEFPRLVNVGQHVVVSWTGHHVGGADDVFVTVSANGGATWLASEIRMDQDAPGAGDSDGIHVCMEGDNVYAVWEDDRNGFDDIYMRHSTDGGVSWEDERFVEETALGSSDASGQTITCSPMGVWIAWDDDRNGNSDVFVNGGTP